MIADIYKRVDEVVEKFKQANPHDVNRDNVTEILKRENQTELLNEYNNISIEYDNIAKKFELHKDDLDIVNSIHENIFNGF